MFNDYKEKAIVYLQLIQSKLVAELERILQNLPFVYYIPFNHYQVRAIMFEYDSESFDIISYLINASNEVICESIVLNYKEYSYLFTHELLVTFDEYINKKHDILLLNKELFENWFVDSWDRAKSVNLSIRGFFSEHDTIYIKDLDKKITVKEFEISVILQNEL